MAKEGKYIYCIIGTKHDRNFGPIGLGGRGDEVLTIGYEDLSIVASNHPITDVDVNHENLVTHEKIIEEVMKEFESVLPVRFGTIASNADEIRNLLNSRYTEFKNLLRDMDHKIELSVKGLWQNMELIYKELLEEYKEIRNAKELIQAELESRNVQSIIEIGKMIKEALQNKKEIESERVIKDLRKVCVDVRTNKTVSDEMFMNAAFLVDKGREKEFDNIMDDLSADYKNRIAFKYVGPLPVFNFINIVIYPEVWEK